MRSFFISFLIVSALSYSPSAFAGRGTAIILVCGNAFGPCSSDSLVPQMRDVLGGIPATLIPVSWGGVKWNNALVGPVFQTPNLNLLSQQAVLAPILAAIKNARSSGYTKVFVAGQSAGGWAAGMAGLLTNVDGIISYYGPMDLPRLWQRTEWGKINSPRGPILYLMPWGVPGCDNCNNPYPTGDGSAYYYDISNPMNPKNAALMLQLLNASPYHYFVSSSPPIFTTQGTEDGIIGKYGGESQAAHFALKHNRPQDEFVNCPTLAHGYGFNVPFSGCSSSYGKSGTPGNLLKDWIQNIILH